MQLLQGEAIIIVGQLRGHQGHIWVAELSAGCWGVGSTVRHRQALVGCEALAPVTAEGCGSAHATAACQSMMFQMESILLVLLMFCMAQYGVNGLLDGAICKNFMW
jgi:hypothetical protein